MKASVKVGSKPLDLIDPKIYGHFIEELGNCIYDGIWAYSPRLTSLPMVESETSNSRLHRVRKDLFDAIAEIVKPSERNSTKVAQSLQNTVLRWPGGCYSDTYHWKNGIGSRSERHILPNDQWGAFLFNLLPKTEGKFGPKVPHQFGTDEYLTFCEQLKIEPYINVNYGTGTPQEAADWVEYVNGDAEMIWGKKRAAQRQASYHVKYWGIANEIWGRWKKGHPNSPEAYAMRYLEYAKAMREKDPHIKLIACGVDPRVGGPLFVSKACNWNRIVLPLIKNYVDYLSVHLYLPGADVFHNFVNTSLKFAQNERAFNAIMASPALYETLIDIIWKDITEVLGADTTVRIAFDEWGLWYVFSQLIKANNMLMDGLWIGMILNVFQRKARIIGMANWAQLVNCIGLIRTDDTGLVLTPGYLAFQLYWKYAQARLLTTTIEVESYQSKKWAHIPAMTSPYLDAGSTISEDGSKITLMLINKHWNKTLEVSIDLSENSGKDRTLTEALVLAHSNPFAMNTPSKRDEIGIRKMEPTNIIAKDQRWQIVIPPHSLNMLHFT